MNGKIKHFAEKATIYAKFAKYPSKKGGVNKYAYFFNIYPLISYGSSIKKYIFDGLKNLK